MSGFADPCVTPPVVITNATVYVQADAPSAGLNANDMWFDTTTALWAVWDGTEWDYQAVGTAGVTSFEGRIGLVVATAGDYQASEVTVDAAGFNGNLAVTDNTVQKVAQKVDDLVVGGAGHDPVTIFDSTSIDLTLTGQQISAAANFGATAGTVAQGDDARFDLQTITLTGDTIGSGTGSFAATTTKISQTVRNESGSTIASTRAVYVSGFNNYPLVSLADNTNEAKHNYIGLTEAPIGNTANGVIKSIGDVSAQTNAWNVGDDLYLSTAGALTNVPPTSGTVIPVGTVTVKEDYPTGRIQLFRKAEPNVIAAASGSDVVLRLGDSSGTNKVSIRDYANAEVASISSDGGAIFAGQALGSGAFAAAFGGTLDTYAETGVTDSIQSSGTITLTLDGRIYEHTLTAAVTTWTITLPTAPISASVVVVLIQAAGNYAVGWPATWYWPDGIAETMPIGAGARLELVIRSMPGGAIHCSAATMEQP